MNINRIIHSSFRYSCACSIYLKLVFLRIYVHVYIHTHTHTHMYTQAHSDLHTYRYTHTHTHTHTHVFFCFTARRPLVGLGLLIFQVSRSSSDTFGRTPLDEWLARRRDLYNTQHSQKTDIHAPDRIRTRNPGKRAATGIGTYVYKVHINI